MRAAEGWRLWVLGTFLLGIGALSAFYAGSEFLGQKDTEVVFAFTGLSQS